MIDEPGISRFSMNIEIKITCNEHLVRSAINEYIYCTFKGILKQKVPFSDDSIWRLLLLMS